MTLRVVETRALRAPLVPRAPWGLRVLQVFPARGVNLESRAVIRVLRGVQAPWDLRALQAFRALRVVIRALREVQALRETRAPRVPLDPRVPRDFRVLQALLAHVAIRGLREIQVLRAL